MLNGNDLLEPTNRPEIIVRANLISILMYLENEYRFTCSIGECDYSFDEQANAFLNPLSYVDLHDFFNDRLFHCYINDSLGVRTRKFVFVGNIFNITTDDAIYFTDEEDEKYFGYYYIQYLIKYFHHAGIDNTYWLDYVEYEDGLTNVIFNKEISK